MVQVRWGLIPFWAKDTKIAFSTINARVETVQTSGTYRNAFKSRRCLVVADGFYEWKKLDAKGKEKQPYRITLKSGAPFGFAGLWETWGKGIDALVSCTIITGPPNELVATIHDRMAVILPQEHWDAWLDGIAGTEMLTPYPAKLMRAYKVERRVGNVRNNDAKLLEALP
jgi:putative SOS response-associated peptidase YedK